ncbi:hypothetical protein F3Y22_tig00110356pilonHSYRG00022 [Hibiscus syriacus]|uniref:Uncharacterized protein n=1 Tax=Hibiscus syriacus TaxID=106335 RepID=A0A6A3AW72_HIBSY|nr:hypothetical protein F3Y22_tig00110356pilonHSYRG00022 [Hibiscus syriacus]
MAKACSNDDLDLVKAAAWAWHQRGSSSEAKPMPIPVSDAKRSERAPGPSRYKLEAMRNNNNNSVEMKGSDSVPIHTSLLDPYEIEIISKRLDQLIELSGIKFYHELLKIDADVNDNHPNKKSSSTKWRGFLRRRVVVCGRNHDVEETALRTKNHAAAANCSRAGAADAW